MINKNFIFLYLSFRPQWRNLLQLNEISPFRLTASVEMTILKCHKMNNFNKKEDSNMVFGFHPVEEVHRLSRQIVKVFIRNSEALHDVVDRLDVELTRAFEAQPLVSGLAVFYFCDKDHRDILAAAGAESRLHEKPPG